MKKFYVRLRAVWIHHKLVNMREETLANDEGKRGFIETARRAQIIECAIDAVAELGFARASLAQIAKRAGVSTGVILYYFGSKKELMREVRGHIAAVGNGYLARCTDQPTAAKALRTRIEGNVALHAARPNYMRALLHIEYARETESDAPQFNPAYGEPRRIALRQIMERGQATGEFRMFDIPAMMRAIIGALDLIQWQLGTNPEFDLNTYGATLVELFDRATRGDAK